MREEDRPVLLGGYAAKQCPVRVQNDFSPQVPTLKWVPSAEDEARLEAGNAFEARIFLHLRDIHPEAVVVGSELTKAEAISMTLSAMDSEASLILGGWLPDDVEGARTGKPDILIRADGGYVPADVKNHLTIGRAKKTSVQVSPLSGPAERVEVFGWTVTGHRYDDGMQLAHYTRMLQACGHHPGSDWLSAPIVGTSRISALPHAPEDFVFVWHDLNEPLGFTFSRSRGKIRRSLLERYDHEHGFRVKVATTARRIVGAVDDPEPLVEPVGQVECNTCPYEIWCIEQMGPEDPSAAINVGGLSPREWLALRRLGVVTTSALSAVDPEDPAFFDDYFPEVTQLSQDQARARLAKAIVRAQMICDGVEIVRDGDGPVVVPEADIEIDIDIEYDIENRVYMWGARLRSGRDETTAQYIADFVDWQPLTDQSERQLAARFASWLRTQWDAATAAGQSLKVFHWSHPERSRLVSLLGMAEVGDLVDLDTGVFVDLVKVFNAHFIALHGSGIKKVAPKFGFSWRVPDPGGAISQTYLSKVRTSTDPEEVKAAKEWLLSYNEDDNTAMAAIRDGMRTWLHADGGIKPTG